MRTVLTAVLCSSMMGLVYSQDDSAANLNPQQDRQAKRREASFNARAIKTTLNKNVNSARKPYLFVHRKGRWASAVRLIFFTLRDSRGPDRGGRVLEFLAS